MKQLKKIPTRQKYQDSKPKADEAIKENTYMDGVCDFQASVAEAKELISNIDEVLDAGGFHIKEWISNAPLTDKRKQR